jgi:hypothetical protein
VLRFAHKILKNADQAIFYLADSENSLAEHPEVRPGLARETLSVFWNTGSTSPAQAGSLGPGKGKSIREKQQAHACPFGA